MQDGLQQAVCVPLALAERVHVLWPYLKEMAAYGNLACKSDAQVRKINIFYIELNPSGHSVSIIPNSILCWLMTRENIFNRWLQRLWRWLFLVHVTM